MSTEDKKKVSYDAQSIKVLEGLEGVRKRPAMYIGTTDARGLHHLVYEVVDNSVDEALAGHCTHIDVILHADGSCSVKDNGRGIPTGIHATEKISAAEVVLTKLHAGGKFEKDSYRYSGGLHGVGVSVVNALSSKLTITICREDKEFYQEYSKGYPLFPLRVVGPSKEKGTLVTFIPDNTIFETVEFHFETLANRFRELAFLNKGLSITIAEEATGKHEDFLFEGGIASFVTYVNEKREVLFPQVIELTKDDGVYVIDLAMQYNDSYNEQTFSFVNNIRTVEGGTHESGFKSALTKICNKFGQKLNLLKDTTLSSDDVREGLVAVLSIKVPEPQFEGQTKTKLGNNDVKGIVDSTVYSFFDTYFEENPGVCRKILQKAILANQARNAAKKARDLTRRKTALESSVLPGTLADCSITDPSQCELYLVEGRSAGGSAKNGRDRFTQAILPLRGKVLNVERARLDKMLANNEIRNLITAIGAGVGNEDFIVEKCRYHKVIIMTDADVDGAHIRILLLTFFFRYMQPLIQKGYLYIANSPLYKAKIGKVEQYLKDEKSFRNFLLTWARNNVTITSGQTEFDQYRTRALIDGLEAYEDEILLHARNLEVTNDFLDELVVSSMVCKDDIENKSAEELFEVLPSLLQPYMSSYTIKTALTKAGTQVILFAQERTNWRIPLSFFTSAEYLKLAEKAQPVYEECSGKSFQVAINSKKVVVDNFLASKCMQELMTLCRSSMTVQRYKGLGEMDAEQLWETTMNPADRSLYKVTIEDAVKADVVFAELMGDVAQDRRVYIESQAHFVRNLDI